jgi:hypothetical protein
MVSIAEYDSLRAFESDYDKAQGQIRQAASVWVLAGFAGIAYVFSHPVPAGLTLPLFGALVCWATAFGLCILWVIDQRVYQRLLHSVFVHGLFLEWKSQSTSQPLQLVRTKIYFDTLNISLKLSLFYIAPLLAFLAVHSYFFFFSGAIARLCSGTGLVAYPLLLSHAAAAIVVIWKSSVNKDLLQQHGSPYPDDFQNYLRNRNYTGELKAWLARP